jgi:N utilization substance protein A
MSREILEAVRGLAAEKNIASEKLMEALEDALLSAYKKTPGAARHAKVEMDRDSGDFKVFELKIPPELEEQLLVEGTTEQEPTVDPETGELREPPEPELDMEKLKEFEDQIEIEDVTPDDFGRIAAQTAKQVILQRIREAERDMMFEEYRDRVGELITGIVQQSDSRYTLVQLRERVEALLPKSEQVEGERYDHSQRIKAVIKDVSNSTKGPSIIVSRRDPELIKQLFRRSPTDWSRSRAWPGNLDIDRRSRSSRTSTASTRWARASARAAPASAWSSPSCVARRSTSSPTTTSPPGSSPRRFLPRACARCSSTTPASRRR